MGRGWFWVVKFRIAKFIQPEKNCGDRAVLVAISIPIFTSQLEKSREAVDIANIRTAYAEVSAEALTNSDKNYSITVNLKQTQSGWQTTGTTEIAGVQLSSLSSLAANGGSVVVEYVASNDGTGTVKIGGVATKTNTVSTTTN